MWYELCCTAAVSIALPDGLAQGAGDKLQLTSCQRLMSDARRGVWEFSGLRKRIVGVAAQNQVGQSTQPLRVERD